MPGFIIVTLPIQLELFSNINCIYNLNSISISSAWHLWVDACRYISVTHAIHPWKSNEFFHNCAHVNFSFISLWFSSATHYPNAFHKFLTINICLNQLRKKLMKMFWVFFPLNNFINVGFLVLLTSKICRDGLKQLCVVFLFLNLIYYNHGQKFWEWHTYWFSKFAASLFLDFFLLLFFFSVVSVM